jgi:hypothetical protein
MQLQAARRSCASVTYPDRYRTRGHKFSCRLLVDDPLSVTYPDRHYRPCTLPDRNNCNYFQSLKTIERPEERVYGIVYHIIVSLFVTGQNLGSTILRLWTLSPSCPL